MGKRKIIPVAVAEEEGTKPMRMITSDQVGMVYGELEFVKQVLDIAMDHVDGMESIIDEALRKTDTLMGFIVDLPKQEV